VAYPQDGVSAETSLVAAALRHPAVVEERMRLDVALRSRAHPIWRDQGLTRLRHAWPSWHRGVVRHPGPAPERHLLASVHRFSPVHPPL